MSAEMNLWTRITAESPKFFRRVIKVAITLSATATAILVSLATIPDFTLPEWMHEACKYCIVAGVVAGAVAKTTMADPPASPNFEKPAAPKDTSI